MTLGQEPLFLKYSVILRHRHRFITGNNDDVQVTSALGGSNPHMTASLFEPNVNYEIKDRLKICIFLPKDNLQQLKISENKLFQKTFISLNHLVFVRTMQHSWLLGTAFSMDHDEATTSPKLNGKKKCIYITGQQIGSTMYRLCSWTNWQDNLASAGWMPLSWTIIEL